MINYFDKAIEFANILKDIKYQNYQIEVLIRPNSDEIYLQASFLERCIASGEVTVQKSRKWLLSPHMTKSEIVQTAFKCVMTAMEHEVRENFRYKGKAIFGPHFDVDQLVELCQAKAYDVRKEPE